MKIGEVEATKGPNEAPVEEVREAEAVVTVWIIKVIESHLIMIRNKVKKSQTLILHLRNRAQEVGVKEAAVEGVEAVAIKKSRN